MLLTDAGRFPEKNNRLRIRKILCRKKTLRRLDANAFTFSPRRTYVSGKTQRRFLVNVLAFLGEWILADIRSEFPFKFCHYLLEMRRQVVHGLSMQGRGDAVECFCNAARDAGQCVAVATQ